MTDVRPMRRSDLAAADRIFRVAFGIRFHLPEPATFRGDAEVIRPRFATEPSAAFVAEENGRIVGGVVGMDWGSVFVIGPLFVEPEHSGRGIARTLVARMIETSDARTKSFTGLFTFPESATHLRLYESFGFMPQALTPIMAKDVKPNVPGGVLWSALSPPERETALAGCKQLTDSIFPGLDLTREIEATSSMTLGETVLLDMSGANGFAVCHSGAGSEAGSGSLFVKFAAVRPNAAEDFVRLLGYCETLAAKAGATRISAGINVGRAEAYRLMQTLGYRAGLVGVAMLRPSGAAYNRPDVYAVDDWR